jgi:hypothetical protein
MRCPNCGGELTYWSDSEFGSYGNACLECKLFCWIDAAAHRGSEENAPVQSISLDLAHFPRSHRSIPRYRAAVGWVESGVVQLAPPYVRAGAFAVNELERESLFHNQSGVDLIAAERQRQVEDERWTDYHDDGHEDGALALAAAVYALPTAERDTEIQVLVANTWTPRKIRFHLWPFGWNWFKPTPDDRVRELVKAGALIAAEIDRLQRLAE